MILQYTNMVGWEIQTKDRKGREGGMTIFSELKIADFPGTLCGIPK